MCLLWFGHRLVERHDGESTCLTKIFPKANSRPNRVQHPVDKPCIIKMMRRGVVAYLSGGLLVVAWLFSRVTPGSTAATTSQEYEHRLKPLLVQYCYDCHGNGEKSGEFAMDDCKSAAELIKAK